MDLDYGIQWRPHWPMAKFLIDILSTSEMVHVTNRYSKAIFLCPAFLENSSEHICTVDLDIHLRCQTGSLVCIKLGYRHP